MSIKNWPNLFVKKDWWGSSRKNMNTSHIHFLGICGFWNNFFPLILFGNLLYLNGTAASVFKVKNKQTEESITLQGWELLNMCDTSTGDFLVTSDDKTKSKVIRYSGSTEIKTIQYDKEVKPLNSENAKIKYIAENRSHDVSVVDFEAAAVLVVNEDREFKWRCIVIPQ